MYQDLRTRSHNLKNKSPKHHRRHREGSSTWYSSHSWHGPNQRKAWQTQFACKRRVHPVIVMPSFSKWSSVDRRPSSFEWWTKRYKIWSEWNRLAKARRDAQNIESRVEGYTLHNSIQSWFRVTKVSVLKVPSNPEKVWKSESETSVLKNGIRTTLISIHGQWQRAWSYTKEMRSKRPPNKTNTALLQVGVRALKSRSTYRKKKKEYVNTGHDLANTIVTNIFLNSGNTLYRYKTNGQMLD